MNHSPRVCPSPTAQQDQLEEVVPQPIGLPYQIVCVCVCVCACVFEEVQARTSSNSEAAAAAAAAPCHSVCVCALEENVGQPHAYCPLFIFIFAAVCLYAAAS